MTPVEVTLSGAVSVLRDDETYPAPVRRAMIDVLNVGLFWYDEARCYGVENPSDRLYRIAPGGRATIALAEAVIKVAS